METRPTRPVAAFPPHSEHIIRSADPETWQTIWQWMRDHTATFATGDESTQRDLWRHASALEWIGNDWEGPTDGALTWDTFAEGVQLFATWAQQPSSQQENIRIALTNWMRWHGTVFAPHWQRTRANPGAVWRDPGLTHAEQARVVSRLLEGLGLTKPRRGKDIYAQGRAASAGAVMASLPLEHLGIQDFPRAVRFLMQHQPESPAAPAPAPSATELASHGITGWLAERLGAPAPDLGWEERHDWERHQRQERREIVAGLGLRPQWPDEAQAVLYEVRGPDALDELRGLAELPLPLIRRLLADLCYPPRRPANPKTRGGERRLLTRILTHYGRWLKEHPRGEEGLAALTPDEATCLREALSHLLEWDRAVREKGLRQKSDRRDGPHQDMASTLSALLRHPGASAFVSPPHRKYLLLHPSRAIRESVLAVLGDTLGAADTPRPALHERPPTPKPDPTPRRRGA